MQILLIAICVTVLAVAFFCALSEAVLLSLNPLRLKAQQRQGQREAALWLELKNHIERPLAAILILNTAATTGLATVAGATFTHIYGPRGLWLFSAASTLVVLLGAEIVPKIVGVNFNEQIAPFIAPVLRFNVALLTPAIFVVEKLCAWARPQKSRDADSHVMDIITLAQVAKAENLIHRYEEIIIIHAATLSARRVKSIMVPRESIRFLRGNLPVREALEEASRSLFTRYPVSRSDAIDDIYGYVSVKELLGPSTTGRDATSLSAFVKPALVISPKANLTGLLGLFFQKRQKFAVVRDMSGAVAGIVSRHDIVQLIIGDKL